MLKDRLPTKRVVAACEREGEKEREKERERESESERESILCSDVYIYYILHLAAVGS